MTKRFRFWGRLTVYLFVPALVALSVLTWFLYQGMVIRNELTRIRAEGFPVTLDELNAFYKTPKGPNAADVYQRAFSLFHIEPNIELPVVGRAELPPRGEPLPKEMKAMIGKYVEENAAAIKAMLDAANIKECRYPVDLTVGLRMRLPHCGKLRDLSRLLRLAATYDADSGRHAESADKIVAGIAAARSLQREPILISSLVTIAVYAITLNGLSYSMSLTQYDDADLRKLYDAIEGESPHDNVIRMLCGERCLFHDLIIDISKKKDAPEALYELTGARHRDELFHLNMMRGWIEIAKLPFPEQLGAAKSYEAKINEALKTQSLIDLGWDSAYPICSLGSSQLDRFLVEDATLVARIRCAQTAIAVERFRLKNNALPAGLEGLVPDYLSSVPVDPFNGKPLIYKKLSKGYVVYSVGANMIDDGGTDKIDPRPDGDQMDVIFQVIR